MAEKPSFLSAFSKSSKLIRHFVAKIVRPEDVEDIVQETFIKSYEADLKQDIEYSQSYMLKTARNLALNHVAKWDNRYTDSYDESCDESVKVKSIKLEDEVTSKERFLQFCRATDKLSPQVKKCFILKKVYGLSQKEIAAQMNISESTVEKHIAKGLLFAMKSMQRHEHQSQEPTIDSVVPKAKVNQ